MAARGNAAHTRMAREHGADAGGPLAGRADQVRERGDRGRGRRHRLSLPPAGDRGGGLVQRRRSPIRHAASAPGHQGAGHLLRHAAPGPIRSPDRFPVWIWMDDPCFYGFPVFGEAGPKAGQDAGGQRGHRRHAHVRAGPGGARAHGGLPAEVHPEGAGPIIYTKTCLYTLTPDRDFVIDRLPGHPNVAVGIGGGHGFKFASLIGRILCELAIDGRTEHEHRAVPDRPGDPAARESAGELHGLRRAGGRGRAAAAGATARAGRCRALRRSDRAGT